MLTKMLHVILISLLLMSVTFKASAHSSPILTLKSNKESLTFTREQLEALPQITFSTSTPWTKGIHTFTGPKLVEITTQLFSSDQNIRIYALNGYSYDIGAKDLQTYPYILALKNNGEYMSLRNKGPLWILLPFDKNPKWSENEKLINQSVWQVNMIEALE